MSDSPSTDTSQSLQEALKPVREYFSSLCNVHAAELTEEALSNISRLDLYELYTKFLEVLSLRCGDAADKHHIASLSLLRHLFRVINQHTWHMFFGLLKIALVRTDDESEFWSKAATSVHAFYRISDFEPLPEPPDYEAEDVFDQQVGYDYACIRGQVGCIVADLPTFHEVFFGEYASLASEIHQLFIAREPPIIDNGWSRWPTCAEHSFEHRIGRGNMLSMVVNEIVSLLSEVYAEKHVKAEPMLSIRDILDDDEDIQHMDFGFMNRHFLRRMRGDSSHSWGHVRIVTTIGNTQRYENKALCDLTRHARSVFHSQLNRRFVLGLALYGSKMRTMLFDRLGALASTEFDIIEDPHRLITVLIGCLLKSNSEIGLDPGVEWSDNSGQGILVTENCGVYRLPGNPYLKYGIYGRGTICWDAREMAFSSSPDLLVKDTWIDQTRDIYGAQSEGEILEKLAALRPRVKNIVRYVGHEDVYFDGKLDDAKNNIRRGIDISEGRIIKLLEGINDTRVFEGNRTHQRLYLEYGGHPMDQHTDIIDVLQVFEDCIIGHRSLYEAGYIHRDIAEQSLLLFKDDDLPDLPVRGILANLRCAIPIDKVQEDVREPSLQHRVFRAADLLIHPSPDTFLHDLESFWWVLVFMACQPEFDESGCWVAENMLQDFFGVDYSRVGHKKLDFMVNFGKGDLAAKSIKYAPLNACIMRFRDVICDKKNGRIRYSEQNGTADSPDDSHVEVYDEVIAVLSSERQKLIDLRCPW